MKRFLSVFLAIVFLFNLVLIYFLNEVTAQEIPDDSNQIYLIEDSTAVHTFFKNMVWSVK